MKSKKIIMKNSIKDTLSLPIYNLLSCKDYYKLEHSTFEKDGENLCYLLPPDITIYEYLYPNKIICLNQVLENLYVCSSVDKNIKKYINKI